MNTTVIIRVVVILSVIFHLSVVSDVAGTLNSEQVEMLVEAAWKLPPESIDITYYETFRDFTKDKKDYEQIFEEAFSQMYGPEKASPPEKTKNRNQTVQLNVERSLAEQETGRKSKLRIRYDENRLRVDHVEGSPARTIFEGTDKERFYPGKKLEADTPYTNSTIEISDVNNTYKSYRISHENKEIESTKKIKIKKPFLIDEISRFSMMPVGFADILKTKLSSHDKENASGPDAAKMEKLLAGTLEGINVTIEPYKSDTNTKVRIEMILYSTQKTPLMQMALICQKEDYSKVFSFEGRVPASDSLLISETRSDFDSQGFPHNVSIFEYDGKGNPVRHKLYQVENVGLNVQLPPDSFELGNLKDYHVIDQTNTLSAVEQQEAEITRLKDLLGHEKWTTRVQALLELKEHLKENPAQLKDIANNMQNDEHPEVRKAVAWILKSLESSN